jgi:hypothetical protein
MEFAHPVIKPTHQSWPLDAGDQMIGDLSKQRPELLNLHFIDLFHSVELYGRVRRAVFVEGKSQRAAAMEFGIARETVRKMLRAKQPCATCLE